MAANNTLFLSFPLLTVNHINFDDSIKHLYSFLRSNKNYTLSSKYSLKWIFRFNNNEYRDINSN